MPAITAALLEQWHKLDEERLSLERRASQLEKARDLLSKQFEPELKKAKNESLVRGPFRAFIAEGNPSVSWKDKYVEAQGAAAADALVQSAPKKKKVKVERIKQAAGAA